MLHLCSRNAYHHLNHQHLSQHRAVATSLKVVRPLQAIFFSSSPQRQINWRKLDSASFPSPQRGRPWQARNLILNKTFRKQWCFSNFPCSWCCERASPMSWVVLGKVKNFNTDSWWHLDNSCALSFSYRSILAVVKSLWDKTRGKVTQTC